jgi:hypothetical protein
MLATACHHPNRSSKTGGLLASKRSASCSSSSAMRSRLSKRPRFRARSANLQYHAANSRNFAAIWRGAGRTGAQEGSPRTIERSRKAYQALIAPAKLWLASNGRRGWLVEKESRAEIGDRPAQTTGRNASRAGEGEAGAIALAPAPRGGNRLLAVRADTVRAAMANVE